MPGLLRTRVLVPLGMVVAGIGLGWAIYAGTQPRQGPKQQASAARPSAPSSSPAPSAPAPPAVPRFDIARIGPDGNAVIAGRAAPGATVTILDAGKRLGDVQANARGEFVFLPDKPLPPGARTLRLRQTAPDHTRIDGPDELVLVVPPTAAGADQPALALLAPAEGAPRVLQGPADPARHGGALAAPSSPAHLGLALIDYTKNGDIQLGGTAPPGSVVRLYVDNQMIGETGAGASGQWSFRPGQEIAAGAHTLRLDQLTSEGHVATRLEVPFRREEKLAMGRPDPMPGGKVVVQPGDSLWLLARQTYGQGVHYTAIYAANRGQIREPDLIYPGQVFSMPAATGSGSAGPGGESSSTSSSSSRSR
jgi:hypothetical protein